MCSTGTMPVSKAVFVCVRSRKAIRSLSIREAHIVEKSCLDETVGERARSTALLMLSQFNLLSKINLVIIALNSALSMRRQPN